jgi:SET domain-containing protein
MKKPPYLFVIVFTAMLIARDLAPLYAKKPHRETAILKINPEYEKRTIIKPSKIPNAGNGLFAVSKIKKNQVIGELGGRLIAANDPSQGNHYIAAIPECAWGQTRPYKSIDSKNYGGHVSRINFAPSKINGITTNFQNAAIRQICRSPYVIFLALKDIEAGSEIWSSYGPNYDYDKFMRVPEVRDFFCALLKIDCRIKFSYSY